MKNNDTRVITPHEAARRLGLLGVSQNPERTILRMARRGELRGVRVARWTMIDPVSVDKLIEARQ